MTTEAEYACCLCGRVVAAAEQALLTVEQSSIQQWGAHRRCIEDALFPGARGFLVWRPADLTVLGKCQHGVDLDHDFCDQGCRV